MALIRLNNRLVREMAAKKLLRPADVSRTLGVSRQMGNYIMHYGGLKYAASLARLFGCKERDLLMSVPSTAKHKSN